MEDDRQASGAGFGLELAFRELVLVVDDLPRAGRDWPDWIRVDCRLSCKNLSLHLRGRPSLLGGKYCSICCHSVYLRSVG